MTNDALFEEDVTMKALFFLFITIFFAISCSTKKSSDEDSDTEPSSDDGNGQASDDLKNDSSSESSIDSDTSLDTSTDTSPYKSIIDCPVADKYFTCVSKMIICTGAVLPELRCEGESSVCCYSGDTPLECEDDLIPLENYTTTCLDPAECNSGLILANVTCENDLGCCLHK